MIVWFDNFIRILAQVLNLAILARVIISWLPISRDNPIVAFIDSITEPILGPIRRVLPFMGGLDLSPFFALIFIQIAEWVLRQLLWRLL